MNRKATKIYRIIYIDVIYVEIFFITPKNCSVNSLIIVHISCLTTSHKSSGHIIVDTIK